MTWVSAAVAPGSRTPRSAAANRVGTSGRAGVQDPGRQVRLVISLTRRDRGERPGFRQQVEVGCRGERVGADRDRAALAQQRSDGWDPGAEDRIGTGAQGDRGAAASQECPISLVQVSAMGDVDVVPEPIERIQVFRRRAPLAGAVAQFRSKGPHRERTVAMAYEPVLVRRLREMGVQAALRLAGELDRTRECCGAKGVEGVRREADARGGEERLRRCLLLGPRVAGEGDGFQIAHARDVDVQRGDVRDDVGDRHRAAGVRLLPAARRPRRASPRRSPASGAASSARASPGTPPRPPRGRRTTGRTAGGRAR